MTEKTLKEISEEIRIDKQKVYRFVIKNHITASSETKQTKLYDDVAQRIIKSHFNCITTSNERNGKPHQKSSEEVMLEQLIKELEVKNELLKEKDKQIAEKDRQLNAVNNMLADSQKLIDQQQQLNAITEQKLLSVEDKQEKQKKWWQRKRD